MSQREMKFRAWDSLTKQWLAVGFHLIGEVTCFDVIGQKLEKVKPADTTLSRMGDVVITQWTGLYDSEGNDVYEGDVVQVEGYWGDHPVNAVGVVKFSQAEFRVRFLNFEGWMSLGSERLDLIKILGNSYEHPELLR